MNRVFSILTAICLLSGCSGDDGPVDSGPENSTTIYSGGSSVVAPAYEPFSHEYTVTDDDGLTASELVIDAERGDLQIERSQVTSASVNITVAYTPSSPSDDRTLRFSGKDDAGFNLTAFTSEIDAQGEVNTQGRISFNRSDQKQIISRLAVFDFVVQDDNGVTHFSLEINGELFEQTFDGQQTTVNPTFEVSLPAGEHTYSMTLGDRLGFEITETASIEIIGSVSLDIQTRDFESKVEVSGDMLHLTHLDPEIQYDTTLVSNGSFLAQLPVGSYAVVLQPSDDKSPLSRIFVTPEHLDDPEHHFIDSGNLIDRSGSEVTRSNYSYLVFGLDQIPGQLGMHSDLISHAEVVSAKDFVEMMVKQTVDWNSRFGPDFSLIHFDVKELVNIVLYTGTGSGPCDGYAPTVQQINNHKTFFEFNQAIAQSSTVGGDPHIRIRVVADSQTIQDYANCDSNIESAQPIDNSAVFAYRSSGGGRTSRGVTSNPNYMELDWVIAKVNGHKLGIVANEQRVAFGVARETSSPPPNKSVMDGLDSGAVEGYRPVPEDRVQYEYDNRHVSIDLAFGPWAQYQLNPITGERGKNVRLAPQQD